MPAKRHDPNHLPPTLLSLPKELLAQIALHLDRPSAFSLARVSRVLVSPAEHRIWRDTDLFLPEHYGEYPLVQPHARGTGDTYCKWAKKEARDAEDRHRAGMKERVKTVMNRADERTWGMVEKLRVVPRAGAVHGIIQLLDFVTPSLKTLEITAPLDHVFEAEWHPATYETLDYKLLDAEITFSRLTHLHIGKGAIRHAFTVVRLLDMTPSISTVDIDFTSCIEDDINPDESAVPHVPYYITASLRIKQLRIVFNDNDEMARETAFDMIRHSSSLEVLQAEYAYGLDGLTELLEAAQGLQQLKEFSCSYHIGEVTDALHDLASTAGPAFPSLSRAITRSKGWKDLFEGLPALPSLELMYLACAPRSPTDFAVTRFPDPTLTCRMTSHMAKQLRASPRLSSIQFLHWGTSLITAYNSFDVLPGDNDANFPRMIIRSLRHGNEELLQARIYNDVIEVQDSRNLPVTHNPVTRQHDLSYETAGGDKRKKRFEKRDSPCWQDYTDFDGHMVPLDIIKKMRQAEGAKTGTGEGRGIEVGAKAWQVLTTWRDEKVEKEKASKALATGKKGDENAAANTSTGSVTSSLTV